VALQDYALFALLGFVAQLVDGALGMAYGLVASSALIASGAPPAIASASVHAAEVVTTGLAGASHAWHRNVDWRLVARLAPAGVAGGVVGAFVLTGIGGRLIEIFVVLYLGAMAGLIVWRLWRGEQARRRARTRHLVPLGGAGGFLDAIGGGGWGPIVNSTLIASGTEARHAIGSASVAEFFVTSAISVAFLATLDLSRYGGIVLALIVGGAAAAPFAGWLGRVLPRKVLTALVAAAIGALALYNLVRLVV
jgi:uncharacterized membrane protein YfcA